MRDAVVTVFGGTGFIGRHVVRRLAERGATVRVPTRAPRNAGFLQPMGNVAQIVLIPFDRPDDERIAALVEGTTHVVNCIGILAERKAGDFAAVQGELPGRIAAAATAAGARRLAHLSAIGADADSASLYARTKAQGEAAVRRAFPQATILRPSVVFGPEDGFFNRFAAMARIAPALPLIGGGRNRFQPVYVGDVAEAVMAGLTQPETAGRTYELGGPRACSMRELMAYMLQVIERRRVLVSVPWGVATRLARLAELAPVPPLTRDQVELLKRDNVVAADAAGLAELGIPPTPLEVVVPGYLRQYAGLGGKLPVA
ncbi:MAG TPA: complex I NDUFA9 subunit family protein [Geminicoccaceae bacterium]|nr:complex I NDUFA9 subunit family protein [Geminicoccus sp.]HMU49602.1 complex I NDUFA9 subunit family protein [Geminicoccaceae bacterium]